MFNRNYKVKLYSLSFDYIIWLINLSQNKNKNLKGGPTIFYKYLTLFLCRSTFITKFRRWFNKGATIDTIFFFHDRVGRKVIRSIFSK